MKRVGLIFGTLFLGIVLLLFLRRPLAETPPMVFGLLSPSWPGQENEERDALRRQGGPVVPGLIAAMKHHSLAEATLWKKFVGILPAPLAQRFPQNQNYSFRRRTAAWALGEMGPMASNAVPELENLRLSASEEDVRVQAAIALVKIQPANPAARSNFLAELRSPNQTPRFFAAQEAGAIHPADPELVAAMIGALNDADGEVRANAAWSVAQLGPAGRAALPRLRELLADSYRHVPVHAAYALARVAPDQSPEAVEAMLKFLQRGTYLADMAAPPFALALGPSATNAIPWLEECLSHRVNPVGDDAAMVGLWRIRREATPEMLAMLPRLSLPAAIRALGELGPLAAAAEPRLRELAASGTPAQREAAKTVLEQIRADPAGR